MQSSSTEQPSLSADDHLAKGLTLVKAIANEIRRKLPHCVEYDDLYQNGVIGLIGAIRNFDSSKGVPFLPYARFRIRGAMLDGLRQTDVLTRHQRKMVKEAQAEGVTAPVPVTVSASSPRSHDRNSESTLETSLMADASSSPYRICQQGEAMRILESAMNDLSPRHKAVLQMIYGQDLKAREIAERFQVNESRVSQIRNSALRKLSMKLATNGLRFEDFMEAAS